MSVFFMYNIEVLCKSGITRLYRIAKGSHLV